MDNVRPTGLDHSAPSHRDLTEKMISQTLIITSLVNTITLRADNTLRFSNFDYYHDQSNEIQDYLDTFSEELVSVGDSDGGLNDTERTNRRNEYVPFNSLTLGDGSISSSTLSSKFKSKIKDKIKNRNKVEWWTKKKKKKKDRPQRVSSSTARTPTTTKRLTTWVPSKSTTSSYFSRPLDYQRPVKPLTQKPSKLFLDALGMEHYFYVFLSTVNYLKLIES